MKAPGGDLRAALPGGDGLERAFADAFRSDAVLPPSPQVPARGDVLTVDEVARWLGVNRKTVYEAVDRGELPCGRMGRRVLLSRTAIEAWLGGSRR